MDGQDLMGKVEKFLKDEIDVKELLSIEDGEIDYLMQVAYLFYKEGKLEESEKIFKGILRIVPDDSYPYFGLGSIYLRRGEFERSIKYYKKGLELNPEDVGTLLNIGEALLDLGEKQEAYKYLIKCKNIVKRDNYPIYTRVRLLLSTFYGVR